MLSTERHVRCDNCEYYFYFEREGEGRLRSECRYNPPVHVPGSDKTSFPYTTIGSWCRLFKPVIAGK